jgi:hypothetical protein
MDKLANEISQMEIVRECLVLNDEVIQIRTNLVINETEDIFMFLNKKDEKLYLDDDSDISFNLSLFDKFENKLFTQLEKTIDRNKFNINEKSGEIGMLVEDNLEENISFFANFIQGTILEASKKNKEEGSL